MKYMLTIFGDEGGWEDVSSGEKMKAGMEPWTGCGSPTFVNYKLKGELKH